MSNPISPIVIWSVRGTEFVDYVLKSHASPTTLVVCSTRESFLQHLHSDIQINLSVPPDSQENNDVGASHPFLISTIHLLASSRTIQLVFVPTLPHLRAYLAVFKPLVDSDRNPLPYKKPGLCVPMLAIFGFATIHEPTSEYSAQGLSRTLAIAVEVAKFAGMKLVLAEPCKRQMDNNANIQDFWKLQVPLLSGSIRLGSNERSWAGRTVDIGRVVGRWCRFMRMHEEHIEEQF